MSTPNADTPPSADTLVKVKFTQTIPDVSWYRHPNWPAGQYKRFRHYMTACSNADDFEFYNYIGWEKKWKL